jgi:hypothetical protein
MNELVPKNIRIGEVLAAHYKLPPFRDWNPSPLMRRLGYVKNPDTCSHSRKGFTPRDGWWCKECGDSL